MARPHRQEGFCSHGHQLTAETLAPAALARGKRECLICRRASDKRRQYKKRDQARALHKKAERAKNAPPPATTPRTANQLDHEALRNEMKASLARQEKRFNEILARLEVLREMDDMRKPVWARGNRSQRSAA